LNKSDNGRQIRRLYDFHTAIAVIRGAFFETFPEPRSGGGKYIGHVSLVLEADNLS
jgi:hypothetical protein